MNPQFVRDHTRAISRSVLRWGRINYQAYPWRQERSAWLALVAEILLSRTRASSVIPVWTEFSRRYPNPEDLVDEVDSTLLELLAPLGLRWRIRLIKSLAATLYDTAVPTDLADLQKLPAVGTYVAAAHMSLYRNRRAVIVDVNIVRWICRLTGVNRKPDMRRNRWLNEIADELTPKTSFKDYNYAVLDLTMTLCTSRPKCAECPVSGFCNYYLTSYQN